MILNSDESGQTNAADLLGTSGPQHWVKADGEPMYLTIIEAVASLTKSDPLDLEPLAAVVDPDALDRLFASRVPGHFQVDFNYAGCDVTAASSGDVIVRVAR